MEVATIGFDVLVISPFHYAMNASISPDSKSHSVFFHREILDGLERFLGSYCLLKTVLCAILLSLFFQLPHVVELDGSPAIQGLLRIKDSIFSQIDFPLGSHVEKKTVRWTVPLLMKATGARTPAGFYALMVFFNVLILVFSAKAMLLHTGDRVYSFLFVCGMGCVFSGSCGFNDVKGFSDIVPFALMVFCVTRPRSILLFPAVYFALLSDERTIMGLAFLGFWWLWGGPSNQLSVLSMNLARNPLAVCLLAFVAFVLTRVMMVEFLGFRIPGGEVGFGQFKFINADYFLLAPWAAFEVFWLLPGLWVLALVQHRRWMVALVLIVMMLGAIGASFMVHDVTKSVGYLVPLFPIAAIQVYRHMAHEGNARLLMLILGILCIIIPTQHYIAVPYLYGSVPGWVFGKIAACF